MDDYLDDFISKLNIQGLNEVTYLCTLFIIFPFY